MGLRATATVAGRIGITPGSVLEILDGEAKKTERAAIKFTRDAVRDDSPVGPGRGGKHLRDQYRFSVTRTPYGYMARLRRTADGWYGRIVEQGRHAGFSRGRHYPAARANPYVTRTAHRVSPAVWRMLEEGGLRAGKRIEARMGVR